MNRCMYERLMTGGRGPDAAAKYLIYIRSGYFKKLV